ncbi:MAG: response regulator [Anaerolineales bacterium]|nr:response regulator [Anaerolineales bacterium]
MRSVAKQKQTIHSVEYGSQLDTAVAAKPECVDEKRYQGLFEATPVSLWEEDFSGVKAVIDSLHDQGVTDFRAYFETHPQDVIRCTQLIKVANVNQATLDLYKAQNKQEILDNLANIFGPDSLDLFKEELILIAEGAKNFQAEGINYTLTGKPINVIIRWSVTPEFEETFSQVIVSIFDVTEQRRTEAQLKLQATALEAVENAIVITSPKGDILWVNPAFTRLTGYTAEEAIGNNPNMLKSGKNDHAFYEDLWGTVSQGKVWECEELINRRKDGSLYYEHMVITPMKDENGRITRYISVKEDITERKTMELQLRRQLQEEELLRRITAIPSGVNDLPNTLAQICQELAIFCRVPAVSFSLLDAPTKAVQILGAYVSPELAAAELSFVLLPELASFDLLVTKRPFYHIPNVHTAPRLAPIQNLLAPHNNQSALLVPIPCADSHQSGLLVFETVEPRAFHIEEKQIITQVVAYLKQMMQRVQAERLVQKERDFAHQVMNNLGQGLFILEPNWTISFCNPAFANLLGYEQSQLVGHSFMEFIQDSMAQIATMTDDERRNRKSVRELNMVRLGGEPISVMMTAVPRVSEFARDGAICVVTDLTAQKKIAKALSEARDQALEASRLKSEFLANMSHEIRTPLNAVIGMTSLLLDSALMADQLDFAQTIRSSGEQLLTLINDILDFSKIEAGKMVLEERPFSIQECVEEAIDIVASKATDAGLELAFVVESNVPQKIVGDVTRIRQILVNLLNNAIKFTDTGEVVLRVEKCQNADLMPPDADMTLLLSVRDTGIGIPPEKLKRLFQSFSQVDASTTRKYGGTGLGLAISKQLVEMMGGKIWVESKYTEGSTFSFTMPTTAAAPNKETSQLRTMAQLVGQRLLIVDDNETNRKILVKQTSLWGMQPQAVPSGPEALARLAQESNFDLAILDMQMPDMDGVTLAEEIHKQFGSDAPPLVMLSSIGGRAEFQNNDHFSAFLTKPVKQKMLLQTLLDVLGETAVSPQIASQGDEIDYEMGQKHPLRILLAEDNVVNQKVALRILERMGYQADVAKDGLMALDKLQQKKYDVVLMDVQMPNMDGVVATQYIREQLPPQEQPFIVAMTAHALTGDREKYLQAGMDNYISKPVRIQELQRVLATIPSDKNV